MKIAIVASLRTAEPIMGGAIRLDTFVKALRKCGMQPFFACTKKSHRAIYPLHLFDQILSARRFSPDLTYAFVQNPTMSVVADLVKLGTHKKLVCHVGSPCLESACSLKGTSFSWRTLYHVLLNHGWWFRLYPRLSDAFIVNTVFQKKQLAKLIDGEDRICLLPPLCDRSAFHPREKHSSTAELKLEPQYRYCAYIGHFTPAKGVEDLIVAFSSLVSQFPDLRLILAWSGFGSRDRVEQLACTLNIEDRIIWMGRVNVPTLLSASDIIILPYRLYVGTVYPPNLILEALCMGTPIVSTNVGCIPEYVINGRTGMLAAPKSPIDLRLAISRLLKNDRLRRSVSHNQIEISKNFDQDCNIALYVKLFRKLVDDEGRKTLYAKNSR